MNNKLGYALIAALLVTVIATAFVFSVLQSEIDSLKVQPTQIPTSSNPALTPEPTAISLNSPSPSHIYSNLTYSWKLKPETRDNVAWLNASASTTGLTYDAEKSWSDNYIIYISSIWEIPTFVREADLQGLVGASFIMHLPVQVTYDGATGYTQATYQYQEDSIYCLEEMLPNMALDGNWTKGYV
jgi:hypothetical protein